MRAPLLLRLLLFFNYECRKKCGDGFLYAEINRRERRRRDTRKASVVSFGASRHAVTFAYVRDVKYLSRNRTV